jgi:ABC-type transport system involved in multi-copper enzyme maturation permease subunit
MMKYLAILKDSVREALDAKVFYVMVGLSGLLILLGASLSFAPVSAEEAVKTWLQQLMFDPAQKGPFARKFGGSSYIAYTVNKVEELDGAGAGPSSSYRVVLRGLLPTAAEQKAPEGKEVANKEAAERGQERARKVGEQERLLKDRFANFTGLRAMEVSEVRLLPSAGDAPPTEVLFELTVRPTRWTAQLWPHQPTLFFGLVPLTGIKVPLGAQVYFIEDVLVNGVGAWVAIIVSVVITAFFIPNMLRKGTIDLLLVKPIRRASLLVYKYIGGLSFIFLNTTLAVGGFWLVMALRTGIWEPNFLLVIPVITFFFAILYSVSALFGVLTRSAIVAILLTCVVWFLLWVVGQAYVFFQVVAPQIDQAQGTPAGERISEGWWVSLINGIHFMLPRTTDLTVLTTQILRAGLVSPEQMGGDPATALDISWGESLSVSLAFIAVMLGLASWRFATKDY